MSKKETTIRIEPPGRIHTEGFVSGGHRCRYCGGRGGFPKEGPDGTTEEVCHDCRGTGEVRAVVTVEWKPAAEGGRDGQ